MSNQKIYFILEIGEAGYIYCDTNATVREFLDKAEQELNSRTRDIFDVDYTSYFKDIHFVYLKGHKLEEEIHLKDYSSNLIKIPIFITHDSTNLIENSLPLINIDDYEELNIHSYGSQRYSFKALDKRTRKEVLISTFKFDDVNKGFEILYRNKIASTLDHCRIVKVIGFRYPLNEEEKNKTKLLNFFDSNNENEIIDLTGYIVVYEYVNDSNLEQILMEYLRSEGAKHDKMNPTIRSKIIYGVASIMKYVHQKGIIHNDLQIKNILIDENCEPKITGFENAEYEGSPIKVDEYKAFKAPFYKAPETFIDRDGSYSFPADVYSYAIILCKMFTRTMKFDGVSQINSSQHLMMILRRGIRPMRPNQIPDPYWELIQRCWKQNPDDRPTFEEIVEELKHDKYAIVEYGMKTNLDELHEYQTRIDSY